MKKQLALTALMFSLALPTATAQAGGMTGAAKSMMGPVSTAQMSSDSDVLFMEVMTMSNLTEILTSQLALKKSQNAEVRSFAQTMIDHHTRAQAELSALAAKKGVRLTDKPGADQRLMYNKLNTLSGTAFDTMYKKVQVDGHAMTLDLIKTYRTVGKDAQALAYAAKTEPVVAMHLDMAKKLP